MLKVPLRKLVVEVRHKAMLNFYAQMDTVGVHLSKLFVDWKRTPLTLELQDRVRHRRLFLSVRRCFFESDSDRSDREFDAAKDVLQKALSGLAIDSLERVGIRQWFAHESSKSFALLVDEFRDRFLSTTELTLLPGTLKDGILILECEIDTGWKYLLRIAPMTRAQWLETVPYEQAMFEDPKGEGETLAKHQASIPDQLFSVDLDLYKEGLATGELAAHVIEAQHMSRELVSKILGKLG